MTDLVDHYRRAVERFGERVAAVGEGQWSSPTPCAEWDVRALVNHVVAEQLWAPHLLAGETIAEVGDRYDGDVLGDDPVGVWERAIGPAIAAFAEPAALDRTVHLSYGDEAAGEYLLQMLTDAAVHGWDLARGIGADDTIEPDTAGLLHEAWVERADLVAGSGLFADPLDVAGHADAQTRLLGLLGRRA